MNLPTLNACFDEPTVLSFVPLDSVAVGSLVVQGHGVLINDAVARVNSKKGMVWVTVTLRSAL